MAYSRYELPDAAFEHIPELFRSIGMNVTESLPKVRSATLFDSEGPDRKRRRVYSASGVDVKISVSKSAFGRKTTAIARLAADGSNLPPDIAQTLDLAFDRIGAKITKVERPLTRVVRFAKTSAIQLYDDLSRAGPHTILPPEPDAETIEAEIRNRNEIRKRSRHWFSCYLAIFVFCITIFALASKYKAFEFPLLLCVLIGFPTMIYLSVLYTRDIIRYKDWRCPRCGRRFMPYASYEFTHTRCRYCDWEIPKHLR